MTDNVEKCLTAIEEELKALAWWSDTPPSDEALASPLPFGVDTLSLPEWLQFILLARLRQMLAAGVPLPQEISVYPMAEQSFAEKKEDTRGLMAAIAQLDATLSANQVQDKG